MTSFASAAEVAAGGNSEEDSQAVAEIEADLLSSFESMTRIEAEPVEPSPALKRFGAGISSVMRAQAIIKHGFLVGHAFEQEGSDGVLFGDVPYWIQYTRISGYRYRLVRVSRSPRPSFRQGNRAH